MTIEQLKQKRAKRKRQVRLTAAAIVLGAVIAVITGILLHRAGILFPAEEQTVSAPPADTGIAEKPESETAEAEEPAGVTDLIGDLTPEPAPAETPSPTPKPTQKPGWHRDAGGRYYIGENGKRKTGFFTNKDGAVYYFDEDGYTITGWLELESGKYWFTKKGIMAKGIKKIGKYRYCFGEDGAMLTGWQEDEKGSTYYFGEDGKAYTGKHEIGDKIYFFSKTGILDPSKTKPKEVKADKLVCLTLDDGPGVYTNQFIDLLEENNAKATFFMIGEQVNDFASAVKREYEAGMEQGNHSWDHRTLTKLSLADLDQEIISTNDVIEAVTGHRPTVFRPPGGGYNDTVAAHTDGMPMFIWSIDTLDWQTKNADTTYNTVMNEVHDGSIIIMHEIYQASYEAAARFIPDLIAEGYQFVTVSEMAKAKGIELQGGEVYMEF